MMSPSGTSALGRNRASPLLPETRDEAMRAETRAWGPGEEIPIRGGEADPGRPHPLVFLQLRRRYFARPARFRDSAFHQEKRIKNNHENLGTKGLYVRLARRSALPPDRLPRARSASIVRDAKRPQNAGPDCGSGSVGRPDVRY